MNLVQSIAVFIVVIAQYGWRTLLPQILMSRSRRSLQACIVVALVAGLAARAEVVARPDLSGTWKLNGGQSDMPSEVGFDPNWQDTESKSGGRSGGGGGRSSGGGGGRGGGRSSGSSGGSSSTGAIAPRFESEEDSRKIRELIAEAKNPPASITITQTDAAITITESNGGTRTYHPTGKEETIQLEAGPIGMVSRWEPAELVIRYGVEEDRELRYAFARAASARQLLVTTQFAERGRGQIITRVYD
jgi:hypothetical protein